MEALFYLMGLVILVSGIGVVVSRNPIHSALWLVANLMTIAGIFASLEAHFLAVVQIVVYAGAIMVLVLFVLMLLNTKSEQPRQLGWGWTLFGAAVGVGFAALLLPVVNTVFSGVAPTAAPVVGSVSNIGKLLYTKYVFTFEAASILIMAAIVGAVMLAKRHYRTQSVGR